MHEADSRHPGISAASLHRWRRPLLVLASWAGLIACLQVYAWYVQRGPAEVFQSLVFGMHTYPAGSLLFIALAALSPLLLLPAALLGAVAGMCYGPVLGVLLTLIGCNASALLTYTLGRWSRQKQPLGSNRTARYANMLRQKPFLSVILLRLSFLPYDPINYMIGFLHLRCVPFLLANTLGCLPGVVLIVWAGSTYGHALSSATVLPTGPLIGIGAGLLCAVLSAITLRKRLTRDKTP